eukprot:CAMPEP_0171776972 /NCGR_PEP_ID=MMETSP0991-20121206/57487_1 /TAXON_ID=483369 /ORGANISM="non described non described, Strain CCMP2098" /LENGTH=35 /DNA_ID= /DNA_START= /DNA_END= /DNA_ORIENTATION=
MASPSSINSSINSPMSPTKSYTPGPFTCSMLSSPF